MNFPVFKHRMGREERAWPVLVLLLAMVLGAVGFVLWSLREAMHYEHTAMRDRLAQVYEEQLWLIQSQMESRWRAQLAPLDGKESAQARFAQCVRDGIAESVIIYDDAGQVAYPAPAQPPPAGESPQATALQQQVRALARAGNPSALAKFVLGNFSAGDSPVDAQGRSVAANAELLALEQLGNKDDPDFQRIADRLAARAGDYTKSTMPSAQRRFVLHALQQMDPGRKFPFLNAEDMAAQFIDANASVPRDFQVTATNVPDLWAGPSPGKQALLLFTTNGLRDKISELARDPALPPGIHLAVYCPSDFSPAWRRATPLAVAPAGLPFPGWQLYLTADESALFDTDAVRREKMLILLACAMIALVTAFSILFARGFGRQVRLARLKNDLVATVSHELKTPLTAMRALVETLIDSPRLDEKTTREYLELIATENARLSRLIENFLTFSRLERNKMKFDFKPVRPEKILDAAVAAFGERAHAGGCAFESAADANLPAIRADPDALATALLNLLDNAWKYSGDQKRIAVHAKSCNGTVCFDVADNGVGLSPRETRRVFARFYQGDQLLARNAGGCGLGLSIVQSIVQAHHGSVRVASEPGRGSTFTMEIPSIPEPSP